MEATIIINGSALSNAEAIILRVALGELMTNLQRDGLGDDETGKEICAGYLHHGNEIFKKMETV